MPSCLVGWVAGWEAAILAKRQAFLPAGSPILGQNNPLVPRQPLQNKVVLGGWGEWVG